VFGGVAFHGPVRFAVVLGEEQFYTQTHYFILSEAETSQQESIADLIDGCRKLEAMFKVMRWYGRLDTNVKEIIAICNKTGYNSGIKNFICSDVPSIGEDIDEMIGTIHRLTRKADKRLHFFGESAIPAEILSLPSRKIDHEVWPRVTALTNAVHGMMKYSGEQQMKYEPEKVENWY
jgi:hypothetical protein